MKDERIAVIKEIIASILETKTYRNIEQSDPRKLVELKPWFDNVVIDTFTQLVGIDGDDLKQVCQDAFSQTRNIDVGYISDLYEEHTDELGIISFIYAWTFRELVKQKVEGLFDNNKIGLKARNVFAKPRPLQTDVKELLQQIKQIGKAGAKRIIKKDGFESMNKRLYVLKSITKAPYVKRTIEEDSERDNKLNTDRDIEPDSKQDLVKYIGQNRATEHLINEVDGEKKPLIKIKDDIKQDVIERFSKGYILLQKAIEAEDFDSLQLPTPFKTPHPDWRRFITERTRHEVKLWVAKEYPSTDVKKMNKLCGPSLDAAAYNQTSEKETFEKDEKDSLTSTDKDTGADTGEEKHSEADGFEWTAANGLVKKLPFETKLYSHLIKTPEPIKTLFGKKTNFLAIVKGFEYRTQGFTYEEVENGTKNFPGTGINQDTMRRYEKELTEYVAQNDPLLIDKARALSKKELDEYREELESNAKSDAKKEKLSLKAKHGNVRKAILNKDRSIVDWEDLT